MGSDMDKLKLHNMEEQSMKEPQTFSATGSKVWGKPGAHQVMTLIENAKTVMDLKAIHDSGYLSWGRGRHDDNCLKDAFLNRCVAITGRHWSDIVIRGMMI